jgi:hypothetical protein
VKLKWRLTSECGKFTVYQTDAERPKMWFATHRFAEILGRGAWVELYRGMSKARALAACEEKANRRKTRAKAR